MTQVCYASTLFGALTLTAAIDAGLLGERPERRLLIVSSNTAIPEVGRGFDESAAFEPLRQRFDEIVRWNELIAPLHPAKWRPSSAEVPMLSRLLLRHLGLDDGVSELVVESIAVPPARTLGVLIRECPVVVYADGLMSYGPTRDELATEIGQRANRLLHLDLVPDVVPLLLRENGVETQPIPDSAFLKVLAELPTPQPNAATGAPIIVGQYLSALEILSADEEIDLHADMLRALVARGHRHVAFKPHPAAGAAHVRPLQQLATQLGVHLTVVDDGLPAEAWFDAARPQLAVSCFSTALLSGRHFFGIPVATMGTELALERITPYQNSNRIPATIVDALVPRLTHSGVLQEPPERDLGQLVEAVGFCMQPGRYPELRPAAASWVRRHGGQRYFKNRRLQSVGLLRPPRLRSLVSRRIVRRCRVFAKRVRYAVRR